MSEMSDSSLINIAYCYRIASWVCVSGGQEYCTLWYQTGKYSVFLWSAYSAC